ncbi:MAG: hypothetical protein A2V67_19430 [Deltaproteobacteria bacterium RBG_13_61_14]|nr:MAG: hypothetical protein A2V67_19430 [Deltaproteobacteria bacterium RBG_13_61_14]
MKRWLDELSDCNDPGTGELLTREACLSNYQQAVEHRGKMSDHGLDHLLRCVECPDGKELVVEFNKTQTVGGEAMEKTCEKCGKIMDSRGRGPKLTSPKQNTRGGPRPMRAGT